MKKFLSIIFVISLLPGFVHGQRLYPEYSRFTTVFGGFGKLNPYYLSSNPAYLEYDGRDQLLHINSSYNDESGSFRGFFDPGEVREYSLNFAGRKNLDSLQTFKGFFGFNRLERHNWNFLANKNYASGSPFLFGDSTTGRTRYNGIIMNAQYSARILQNLLSGISLTYGVDEGLKQVSPRPTSDHRDIYISAGAAYFITSALAAGISLNVFDLNEQINYREDEGAVYTETILFKFRGYDYPFRISKKVETRLSYHNGYSGSADIYYRTGNLTLTAFAGAGLEHLTLKEDPGAPRNEGYWRNNTFNAGAAAAFSASDLLKLGFKYQFNSGNSWAKHPWYNTLMDEYTSASHTASLGAEFAISSSASAGIELNAAVSSPEYKDYHSQISWNDENRHFYSALLGFGYHWSPLLYTFASAGASYYGNSSFTSAAGNNSPFFLTTRYTDLHYLSSNAFGAFGQLQTTINAGGLGFINVYLTYNDTDARGSGHRQNWEAAVELKIKAY